MKKALVLISAMIMFCLVVKAQDEARLMRFPALYGNQVVFTYAGDLYSVDRTGGVARKLTNDENGYEMFARFSPDGKQIAFTGQYDGNTEVYLIPSEGGVPKRITYTATLKRDDVADRMGPNNIVMTWRDDKSIIYRSRKQTFNDFKGQLFVAGVNGGLSEELPLPAGGFCSFNADKSKMAYNRIFREFRTWKYYHGGMADDVWIYDFRNKTTENITNNKAQDIFPMWAGDKVYFCSDRDRIMNLFSYDLKTKETKKLTNFSDYDIKFPSLGNDAIVFEKGGFIFTYDLASGNVTKLTIRIVNDLITGRNPLKDFSKFLNSSSLSPDGKRVVFDARGDLVSVPAKSGITYNLTKTPGVHERNVAWSPNGKYIAYISDKTGEDEIYLMNQDGTGEDIQLTKNADTYKYAITWSPDSKKILWSDKLLRLQYVDVNTKEVTLVAETREGEYGDYSFSPDSKWIVYTNPEKYSQNRIYLYELATKKSTPVTDGWYDSGNGSFSSDGKYLFFTSNRDFNPTYSWTEWNHSYSEMSRVYFVTLAKKTSSPFKPENDEVAITREEKAEVAKEEKTKKKKEEAKQIEMVSHDIKIDLDGIMDRIIDLPLEAAAYYGVNCTGRYVYYIKSSKGETSFMIYDLEDKKESTLGDYRSYEISSDGKKMLIVDHGKHAVIDIPHGKINVSDWMNLSNMKYFVDLKAEWSQMYHEAWRQMKYFYFAPNMSGIDWEGVKKKYEPLLPYVNHRNDLSYIMGEMVAELSTGHAYIEGGDKPQPERIKQGLLGAKLSRDASGYYKIDKILKGENWTKDARSPLTEVGVDVKEGDYIIEVNGHSTKDMTDIYESLVNTADDQVELTVNAAASETGSHKVLVIPVDNEGSLYYYNWVQENIRKVNEATNGEVGYIHIPDMGPEGLNEFVKHFYPQINKRALIIDDRGNGGGNVSPMIIERLSRVMTMISIMRNQSQAAGRLTMNWGPKCILIDHYSASDGDLFPYQFKKLGIGKSIGTRTWGGVVGIRGSLPFLDGGSVRRPEFAPYDTEGKKWIIEGEGVEPDIYVENDPAKEYAGEDEQLNKAIEVIKDELKSWPKELPAIPPFPDKTK
ncbi:MAG: S41 family peptidase [Syntrophothermus sp.]